MKTQNHGYRSTFSLTSPLYGCGCSKPRPVRLTLRKKTRHPLYRIPVGPQEWSGRLTKISPTNGIRSPYSSARSDSNSLHSFSSSWLVLILHIPCPTTGPYILASVFLSHPFSLSIPISVSSHLSSPHATTKFRHSVFSPCYYSQVAVHFDTTDAKIPNSFSKMPPMNDQTQQARIYN